MTSLSLDEGECLLPKCKKSGPLQQFKLRGVKKLLDCAVERNDDDIRNKIQTILDSQGEDASVELHKSCYCSFTSKDHVNKLVSKKRVDHSTDSDEPPIARTRLSQVTQFDFKKQCLFCSENCKPIDLKHPDRWDRVVQCERLGIFDAAPFKGVVLNYCNSRNDEWAMEVSLRCSGVHDSGAAEAQYHVRCYDEFRKVPVRDNDAKMIDDVCLNGHGFHDGHLELKQANRNCRTNRS